MPPVEYCSICTFPYEYCEFGGTPSKCKINLKNTHPDIYSILYPENKSENIEEDIVDPLVKLKLEKALRKDINREGLKEEREKKKLEESRVKIKTAQRQGKKQVTLVSGLHHFKIDLKKCSKLLASKFACSSSIAKNACNEDEIAIQGDFLEDVAEFLIEQFPGLLNDDNVIQEARKRK